MTEIQRLIKDDGRSYRWFAREVGFAYSYVLPVIERRAIASPRVREAVSRVLERSPEELFDESGFAKPA